MPTYCRCGNETDAERPAFILVESPCRCAVPGRPRVYSPPRTPPIDLRQPSDPNRRRLGLPALTEFERYHLPKDQHGRYE